MNLLMLRLHLNSTMVLLKRLVVTMLQRDNVIYIPLWFFSNARPCHYQAPPKRIYIPLWFFSNQLIIILFVEHQRYLHSTMVLLKLLCLRISFSLAPFTFHYGSSQTVELSKSQKALLYLHSTMVLLKQNNCKACQGILPYLHSTMVLLKLDGFVLASMIQLHLHSTMVLLKPNAIKL